MSISRKLMTVGGGDPTYVEDVFSTYLYSGTGVSQDIVNGVDLDDKGGLVWIKNRNNPINTGRDHVLFDDATSEGGQRYLTTSNASTLVSNNNVSPSHIVYNSEGFTLGTDVSQRTNLADDSDGNKFVSWSFAKQEGFFDVVTWEGGYGAGREIPHNLGSVPGMIIVKCLNQQTPWVVYHKSLGPTKAMDLNEDDAAYTDSTIWNNTAPTDTHFTLGSGSEVNSGYDDYVAYVFADDAPVFGPDGDQSVIKCGSYTGNGTAGLNEIDLGWEPQWVMIKESTYGSDWFMVDAMRGWGSTPNEPVIRADERDKEKDFNTELTSADFGAPTPTGFVVGTTHGGVNLNGNNYIYMAIRRPMKPASEFEPDELFAVDGSTTNLGHEDPAFRNSGFQPGMAWYRDVSQNVQAQLSAPLIQGNRLDTTSAAASTTSGYFAFDYPDGWGSGAAPANNYSWMFRRAPGFFDVVSYEGTNSGPTTDPWVKNHNLGAVPEMMWIKNIGRTGEKWNVYSKSLPITQAVHLNQSNGATTETTYWINPPTATEFTVGGSQGINKTGDSYMAWLWASVPGICDIGSYTGTGADLNVDCGFTNGARFILIKRTDSSGDWLYFDTLRGVTNSDSPRLRLNAIDAQNSGSYVKPLASGFTATSNLTGIDGAEYIYMAIA